MVLLLSTLLTKEEILPKDYTMDDETMMMWNEKLLKKQKKQKYTTSYSVSQEVTKTTVTLMSSTGKYIQKIVLSVSLSAPSPPKTCFLNDSCLFALQKIRRKESLPPKPPLPSSVSSSLVIKKCLHRDCLTATLVEVVCLIKCMSVS